MHHQFDNRNTGEMAKTYAHVPVHKMASQLSFGSSILGGNGGGSGNDQTMKNAPNKGPSKIGSFISLASGPSDKSLLTRPPQPSLSSFSKGTNLGQMKAPTILERPAKEENDEGHTVQSMNPKSSATFPHPSNSNGLESQKSAAASGANPEAPQNSNEGDEDMIKKLYKT